MESKPISADQDSISDFAREYREERERSVSEWRADNPAVNRYFDLYRAARLQITMGSIVKVVGVIVGIGIFLIVFLAGLSGSTSSRETELGANVFFGGLLGGAIFGVVVGGFVFLFGVMIATIGQLLLAQADTAIHTSPFLTKEEKARAMSLTYRT